jgi:hypothetical protein
VSHRVSILVVQLTAAGLLFGADRNITWSTEQQYGQTSVISMGQAPRPKVLRWPNRDIIVGYVGEAEAEAKPIDEWLYSFIGRNLAPGSLNEIAQALTADLNHLMQAAGSFQTPSLLHLGGFEYVDGQWKPRIYFIRNASGLTPEGSYVMGGQFDCSEEIIDPRYFGAKSGDEIRAQVATQLFSFRQGCDLPAFNIIDEAVRVALQGLVQWHPAQTHTAPTTLDDWTNHVKFEINTYGAYFASFYPPYEQLVGGGADVVSVAWPDDAPTS